MTSTVQLLADAGQDFEWYPTTRRMVDPIRRELQARDVKSVLDIGAGDGRVLKMLAEGSDRTLYAIEKSSLLLQLQPDEIVPVGTDFHEQDLMSLPVDAAFSNPPYREFEVWAARIISTVHTSRLYLILPQRWRHSEAIAAALSSRGAKATVIHEDHFADAERQSRAVVHVLRVTFDNGDEYRYGRQPAQDPFDIWFNQNIDTFDQESDVSEFQAEERTVARLHRLDSITSIVAAFDEEYARMQENYKAIFRLDGALFRELGVKKDEVREGLKKRMKGLKRTYWQALFEHLEVVTSRLSTKTKKRFLERLTGQTGVAFTSSNAYAVALWAIKAANRYFDIQVVDLFRELSTHDGVMNYASNQRTWGADVWRYHRHEETKPRPSHYRLDYRIVLRHYRAIHAESFGRWENQGGLSKSAHEVLDDVIAVFGNLGFRVQDTPSRQREWVSNGKQTFTDADGRVLIEVRAFINGNLHFRFDQKAIKALNIEGGRLLGWLRGPADVVTELGYTAQDAELYFGANQRLGEASVKLLASGDRRGRVDLAST